MINETIQLAVDGSFGIYVPQRFFERFPQFLEHLNEEDQEIITNPKHEHYFEVWDYFVSTFEVIKDGHRWFIHQDDDVFFVSEHHQFDNE